MSKHTPGPWSADGAQVFTSATNVAQANGYRIDRETVAANALLIAAAPELLEACLAIIEWDARENDHAVDFQKRMELCELAFQKARAAIAKATGETK